MLVGNLTFSLKYWESLISLRCCFSIQCFIRSSRVIRSFWVEVSKFWTWFSTIFWRLTRSGSYSVRDLRIEDRCCSICLKSSDWISCMNISSMKSSIFLYAFSFHFFTRFLILFHVSLLSSHPLCKIDSISHSISDTYFFSISH